MDLTPLRIAAALVSPWPTWRVEAEDEPSLIERITACGPVPQADLFEPWDPEDHWSARVVWPDLTDPDVLLGHGVLEDGVAPGLAEWMDRGRVGQDELVADSVRAVCLSDLEAGGLLTPDLIRLETEVPEIVAVGLALLASVGATGDRDQVTLVQHRTTGRMGLLLEVSVSDREPMVERQAVLEGVASVVTSDALKLRLAPDLLWWFELQQVAVLGWLVAPSRPVLPSDSFDAVSVDLSDEPGRMEVQVAAGDDDTTLELGVRLGALGFAGSRPRWVVRNGEPLFLSCWEGPADAAVPALEQPFRVVPGCPTGLEGDWLGVDASYWASGERIVCRWHCGLRDRDLLPRLQAREADDVDKEIVAKLSMIGAGDPVFAGRPALRFKLPAMDDAGWQGVVDALGALSDLRVAPVAWVGMSTGFTLLLFRNDLPIPDGEPAWESC